MEVVVIVAIEALLWFSESLFSFYVTQGKDGRHALESPTKLAEQVPGMWKEAGVHGENPRRHKKLSRQTFSQSYYTFYHGYEIFGG